MRFRLLKNENKEVAVKLVAVGDGMVGKTSLLLAYMRDQFIDVYEPTIYETMTKEIKVPTVTSKLVYLTAEDTAGQEAYENLRPLAYSNVDVVLLCFSVDYPDSLANVTEKWITEIRHYCGTVPVLLIGMKVDLRLQESSAPLIDTDRGRMVAQQIGAPYYIECSAKTRQNIDQVFQAAVTVALKAKKSRKVGSKCTVL